MSRTIVKQLGEYEWWTMGIFTRREVLADQTNVLREAILWIWTVLWVVFGNEGLGLWGTTVLVVNLYQHNFHIVLTFPTFCLQRKIQTCSLGIWPPAGSRWEDEPASSFWCYGEFKYSGSTPCRRLWGEILQGLTKHTCHDCIFTNSLPCECRSW